MTDTGHYDDFVTIKYDKFGNQVWIKTYNGPANAVDIGLAMTLEIIQLHGGEIEVSSELDVGTQFTIRIPKEEYYLGKE